jgi:hypothetical protein
LPTRAFSLLDKPAMAPGKIDCRDAAHVKNVIHGVHVTP